MKVNYKNFIRRKRNAKKKRKEKKKRNGVGLPFKSEVADRFVRMNCFSFGKNEANCINEDAAKAGEMFVAVSDGAGGGGVFADRWSERLLANLSAEPIASSVELNAWLDNFADDFYEECEKEAIKKGGLFLDKFYEEGSFATLSVIWKTSNDECAWLQYGDSVAFCWNPDSGLLQHSFSSLQEFDSPPFLINTIEKVVENGVRTGKFSLKQNSVVFVASDALSHLLLMLYAIENQNLSNYKEMVEQALAAHSKTSNLVRVAMNDNTSFKMVLDTLLSDKLNDCDKQKFLYDLELKGLLARDDYSLAYARCSL